MWAAGVVNLAEEGVVDFYAQFCEGQGGGMVLRLSFCRGSDINGNAMINCDAMNL